MKVLLSFTLASLRQNRSRTRITIWGIILSMTLFTAVLTGAGSGVNWLIENEISRNGAYHGYFSELDEQQTKDVLADSRITKASVWREVGWGEIGSEDMIKPYLHVFSVDENAEELAAIHLIDGRMPVSPDEILLPRHLRTVGGVKYGVGDTFTVSLGRRIDSHDMPVSWSLEYHEDDERLTDLEEKTYTVVGTYERLSSEIETYYEAGFIALTAGDAGDGQSRVLFALDDPSVLEDGEFSRGLSLVKHQWLLTYTGHIRNNNVRRVVFGFVGVLLALIMVGSIALIYNSFSLSFAEREKSLGIFKSVGATKRQIRAASLMEALILCGVGIPVGLGIGLLGTWGVLAYLRDDFSGIYGMNTGFVPIGVSVSFWLLLLAVALCLFTVLCSVWVPAGRVIRSSSLESIRQEREIRLKHVRSGKGSVPVRIARRNYRANRRKHRVTILSLAFSLVLIIVAASFASYLERTVNAYTSSDTGFDLTYTGEPNGGDPEQMKQDFLALPHVDTCVYELETWLDLYGETDRLHQYIQLVSAGNANGQTGFNATLLFLEDDAFRELCRENGEDPDSYYSAEGLKALAVNHCDYYLYDENYDAEYYSFDLLERPGDSLMLYLSRRYDGLSFGSKYPKEDGGWEVTYLPEEAFVQVENPETGDYEVAVDYDYAVVKGDEAVISQEILVGALIRDRLFYASGFSLIFPYSMKAAVLPDEAVESDQFICEYYFLSRDHAAAFEELSAYLEESGMRSGLYDYARERETARMALKILYVFSACFITLMALIAVLNVYHTMATNIRLRRREFAVLRSLGMNVKTFRRMLFYEGGYYLIRGLVLGVILAVGCTYGIYSIVGRNLVDHFYVPVAGVLGAAAGAALLVFLSVGAAWRREKKKNLAEEIRNELM